MSTQPGSLRGDRIRAADGVKREPVVVPAGSQAEGLVGFSSPEGQEPESAGQAQGLMEQSRNRSHALLSAAQAEAQDILSDAKQQAESLLEQAKREAEALRGSLVQQTRAELEAEYAQRFKSAAAALESAGKELRRREDEYLEKIEQPALSLMLTIARQLIRAEWEQDRAALARMVGAALRQLQPEDVAVLHLAPETYAAIAEGSALNAALSENGVRIGQIRLEEDPGLSAGQFSLRAGTVAVSFDLDKSLAEMAAHLRLAASGQLGGAPDSHDAHLGLDAQAALAEG